jgi:hypothetical protein
MAQLSDVIRSGIRAEDLTGMSPDQQKAIEPLLRFVNTGIQGLAAVLSAQVGSDNLRTEVQTVPLSHGVAQLVSLKKLPSAKGIRALSVGSADGKKRHTLAAPLDLQGTTVPNQVKVTAYFMDTSALRAPVTFELMPDGSYSAIPASTGTWLAPTLINSWAATGAPDVVPGYMKDSLGFVHLRGSITGGVNGTVAFTLPTGYRPSATHQFAAQGWNGAAFGAAFFKVLSTGDVEFDGGAFGSGAGNCHLSGITFDTR